MYSSVNTTWVLVGAALVFFMQAGFAMVETGFTRAKNAGNIIMKNLMDFCIGTPVFWLVGFGIMFGAGNGFFGKIGGIASEANYGNAMLPDGVPFWAFLIFQTVFCATSATIVSGAMAERTKFISYCIYSLLISLVVYPVSGHWIWGGGFISQMGFHDFAGSCAVHMVGGVAALIGAIILGPRIGKYSKSGKSRAIPGHNLTVGAVGVHGLNGAFGTLAVGLFSDGAGTGWKGLLTGGGFHGFGVQFIGMAITIAWVAVTMTIIFQVIKHTIGLRVSAEEEIAGLDMKEHGLASAYDGFFVQDTMTKAPTPMGTSVKAPVVKHAPSAPAESVPEIPADGVHKLTKVVIITRQNKLDEFMQAMNEIGVTGITITNVMGCGVQKGAPTYYRGVEVDMNLRPKVKIEIVVSLVPVQKVIDTAKEVLHTGQIGDGKVFVYDIENVVKIRTGEEGFLALQDTDA